MLARLALVALMVVSCTKEKGQDCPASDPNFQKDPLECITPLPAVQSDGTTWPSYSEKLADLESCRDGDESLAGRQLEDRTCADGKHALVTLANLGPSSYYYYRADQLVGIGHDSDLVFISCDGCTSEAPQGTPESVTCDVVATTEINCLGFDAGDAR